MIEDVIRDESPAWVNANIDRDTLATLEEYKNAAPEKVQERIDELAWEYDVSCATSLAFAAIGLGGLALSRLHKGFLALPAIANGLLLVQNLPVPSPGVTALFRVAGFRSRTEIERERQALKMLRGDYARAKEDPTAKGAMTSAQSEGKANDPKPTRQKRRITRKLADAEETEPLGEELRPMDIPLTSTPAEDDFRH